MAGNTMTLTTTNIETDRIQANPDQPRKHFDPASLEQLAESIRTSGLLQPITVRPLNGGYQVVAGERRLRAIKMLAWGTVPCIIRETSDREAAILAAMENIARSDMNPMEEAMAMQGLMDLGLTRDEVAERLGTTPAIVQIKTSLLGCIDSVKHLVARGQFSATMAGQLSRLTPDGQLLVLRQYQAKPCSQVEFSQIVNAIYAREANLEMFPETKVSPQARESAAQFRSYIDSIARNAEAIITMNLEEAAPVLTVEFGRLGLTIDEGIKALQRARNAIQREKGRQQGAMMVGA